MGKEIVADDFFSNQDPKTWNSSGSADNAMSVVLLQSGREIISNQSPGFLVQTPSISAISLLQWYSLDWVHVPVDTFFVMLFHGLEIHRAEAFISFSSYSVVQSMMDHVNLFTSFKAMHNTNVEFRCYMVTYRADIECVLHRPLERNHFGGASGCMQSKR